MGTITPTPAGWYADPLKRHEYRYWDSVDWTDNVADRGVTSTDPVELSPSASVVTAPGASPASAAVASVAATPSVPVPLVAPTSGVETREIALPDGRRFYWGQMTFGVGAFLFLVIATVGWGLSLGARASGSAPGIFLGSRGGSFTSEWYVPGILLAGIPFVLFILQSVSQRVDRKLKDRRSRESLSAQLGLGTSWRFTTAYTAKSFRRRTLPVIGSVLALLAAVATVAAVSGDGFTLAPGAFILIAGGVLMVVGALIQRFTPYRRLRVDSAGQVFAAN